MPISFKWFFNNRPVKEFSGITTVKLGNRNSVLNIDSVTGKHAGQYTCEASNEAASINYTSQLIINGTHREISVNFSECILFIFRLHYMFPVYFIQSCHYVVCFNYWKTFSFISQMNFRNQSVPPKLHHFDFGEEPSNFGDSASVQCLAISGDQPIDFQWLFNGRPVSQIAGITTAKMGKRNSVLTIDSVTDRHVGNFTCRASNIATTANYTAELIVNGTSKWHFQSGNNFAFVT